MEQLSLNEETVTQMSAQAKHLTARPNERVPAACLIPNKHFEFSCPILQLDSASSPK